MGYLFQSDPDQRPLPERPPKLPGGQLTPSLIYKTLARHQASAIAISKLSRARRLQGRAIVAKLKIMGL